MSKLILLLLLFLSFIADAQDEICKLSEVFHENIDPERQFVRLIGEFSDSSIVLEEMIGVYPKPTLRAFDSNMKQKREWKVELLFNNIKCDYVDFFYTKDTLVLFGRFVNRKEKTNNICAFTLNKDLDVVSTKLMQSEPLERCRSYYIVKGKNVNKFGVFCDPTYIYNSDEFNQKITLYNVALQLQWKREALFYKRHDIGGVVLPNKVKWFIDENSHFVFCFKKPSDTDVYPLYVISENSHDDISIELTTHNKNLSEFYLIYNKTKNALVFNALLYNSNMDFFDTCQFYYVDYLYKKITKEVCYPISEEFKFINYSPKLIVNNEGQYIISAEAHRIISNASSTLNSTYVNNGHQTNYSDTRVSMLEVFDSIAIFKFDMNFEVMLKKMIPKYQYTGGSMSNPKKYSCLSYFIGIDKNSNIQIFFNESDKAKRPDPNLSTFVPSGSSHIRNVVIDANGNQKSSTFNLGEFYAAPSHFINMDKQKFISIFNIENSFQLGLMKYN